MRGIQRKRIATSSCAALLAYAAFPLYAFAEGGGDEVGMRLLVPKLSEFIPALIAFLVIWAIMAKFAWPAITGMLDKRAQTIKDSLSQAEAARIEAQRMLEEYKAQLAEARKEAAEILQEAKRSGEAVRVDITAKAQAEADQIVAKARQAIESEKKQALSKLQGSVADLSVSIAGRLIGEGLNEEGHRKLIEKYLAEVGSLDEN